MGRTKDLKANYQRNSDDAYNAVASSEKRSVDKSLKNVKNDFNSRGLLGSGLQADQELGVRGQSANKLATARRDINTGLLSDISGSRGKGFDLASMMTTPGANTSGYQLDVLANQLALSSENEAIQASAYGNLAAGGGALAGSIYGGRR
jgi:hypothetical protein